jgi:hypothetical protein
MKLSDTECKALSLDDQQTLLDLLHKRLVNHRRNSLSQEVAEIRQEYTEGNVRFGSVSDFLQELDNQS